MASPTPAAGGGGDAGADDVGALAVDIARSLCSAPEAAVRGWSERAFYCSREPVEAVEDFLRTVAGSPAELSVSSERLLLFRDRRLAVPLSDLEPLQLARLALVVRRGRFGSEVRAVGGGRALLALALPPGALEGALDRKALASEFLRAFVARSPLPRAARDAAEAAVQRAAAADPERGPIYAAALERGLPPSPAPPAARAASALLAARAAPRGEPSREPPPGAR